MVSKFLVSRLLLQSVPQLDGPALLEGLTTVANEFFRFHGRQPTSLFLLKCALEDTLNVLLDNAYPPDIRICLMLSVEFDPDYKYDSTQTWFIVKVDLKERATDV